MACFTGSIYSAGPLPLSLAGYKYVIIIIENFSKWIELVAVMDLKSATIAQAFQERVLARFGAPIEVTIDNGSEYVGEFRVLLAQHGIQHNHTSAEHASANGAA